MAHKGKETITETLTVFGPGVPRDFTLQNAGTSDIFFDYGNQDAVADQGLKLSAGEDVTSDKLPGMWRAGAFRLTAICNAGESSTLYWHA